MTSFRSIVTHVAVATVGGAIALGGYLYFERGQCPRDQVPHSVIQPTTPSTVAIDLPKPAVKELKEASRAFVAIAKAVQPAVVNINTVQVVKQRMMRGQSPFDDPSMNPFEDFFGDDMLRRFFGQPPGGQPREQERRGLGSGMIIDAEKGYILTNNHVITEADQIKVTLSDGRNFEATVVGTDPQTDVGVVQLKNPPKDLIAVALGDSDIVAVGDWAIAVGNPFGLSQTVTVGIISAKGRANVNVVDYEDFIQTDAAINPGNSGGPLLNVEGQVIGLNTAIFSRSGGYQGIGFAIPSNMARAVLDKLVKGEKIERGFLGVYLQDLTGELAKSFKLDGTEGALVTEIIPGSPAEKAGFKSGDVVVELARKPIKSVHELRNRVAFSPVGQDVDVVVIRDGAKQTLKVNLGEKPDETVSKSEHKAAGKLGLSVTNVTPELRQQFRLEADTGVVVVEVDAAGIAARIGLQPGDVLLELNRKPIHNVEDFKTASAGLDPEKSGVLVRADRQGRQLYLALQP